jgi:hypothetical protein
MSPATAALAVSPPDAATVLAKATARASELLGLKGVTLARTLGLSEPTVSRLLKGQKGLAPDSKEGELALLLVRVYRSLDALVGTDDQKRLAWMSSYNQALGGEPCSSSRRPKAWWPR